MTPLRIAHSVFEIGSPSITSISPEMSSLLAGFLLAFPRAVDGWRAGLLCGLAAVLGYGVAATRTDQRQGFESWDLRRVRVPRGRWWLANNNLSLIGGANVPCAAVGAEIADDELAARALARFAELLASHSVRYAFLYVHRTSAGFLHFPSDRHGKTITLLTSSSDRHANLYRADGIVGGHPAARRPGVDL